jgi:hypothetical protein
MTTPNLFEYSEHLKKSKQPILGMLVWYTVPVSSEMDHLEYCQLVETLNPPIKTPDVPKPAHVFRRACQAARISKVRTSNPEVFHNYVMRDAGYDPNFVHRRIIEEKVDAKDHSLGFRDLGHAVFSKEGVSATYQRSPQFPVGDPSEPYWQMMQDRIDTYLVEKMNFVPAIAIREGARKALEEKLRGVKVREGGGVYFVAADKLEPVEALDKLINTIPGASCHILPLVDDVRQRQMLKEAFENETVEETSELIGEIAELLASDKNIPAKTFISIQQRYLDKRSKLKEYSALLNDALDQSETILMACNAQLAALLDKASD